MQFNSGLAVSREPGDQVEGPERRVGVEHLGGRALAGHGPGEHLPALDVLAGGLSTVLNAQADEHSGVPGWVAYPLESANTVGTIALAAVVGGAVAGLAVFAGAPVLGVAAGVAAGAVVAYGVGDYVHNLIADMPQQWDKHGALGIVTDFGAAGVSTWDDTKHLGSDVSHLASSAWHGIMSLL